MTSRNDGPVDPSQRRIFAMGGGGFTMEPDNPALDDYILSLARAPHPKILHLPTAAGDSHNQVVRFHAAFSDRVCDASHLTLFDLGHTQVEIHDRVMEQDIVYVGGGSMRNMLAIWREHKLDQTLRDAWECGVVLAGLSAGSMCWFEAGISKSGGKPGVVHGLGLLPGSNCVHYDGEPERRPVYHAALLDGAMPAGYACDDGAGLLFAGDELIEGVTSRPDARAFRVEVRDGEVVETRLPTRFLDAPERREVGPPPDVSEMRSTRLALGHGSRSGRRAQQGD